MQREEPVLVEAPDVSGVRPPAAQRLRGPVGLLPISGHDDTAAHDDLARLTGGKLAFFGVVALLGRVLRQRREIAFLKRKTAPGEPAPPIMLPPV